MPSKKPHPALSLAWRDAKAWLFKPREIVPLVVIGVATVLALHFWAPKNDKTGTSDALFALAAIGCAAIVIPTVVFCASLVTAPHRLLVSRLTDLEATLPNRVAVVRAPVSESVTALIEQEALGKLVLHRCPKGQALLGGTNPPALVNDVNDWISATAAMLADWPAYQAQFSGAVATDSPLMVDPLTSRMRARLSILQTIIEVLRNGSGA